MKLDGKFTVESDPPMQVGHKVKRDRHGKVRVSRTYTAQYCIGGRHRYVALGTRNKAAAIRRVHEIALSLARGEDRPPVKRSLLSEVVATYLQSLTNQGRSSKTLVKYTQVLADDFVEWFGGRSNGLIGSFTEMDFWAFRKWMADERKKKLSPKTIADRLTIVKQFFKFATKHRLIAVNTIADATFPDPPPTPQPCFTADQVAKLIDAAPSTFGAAIYATMAFTGMRFGEVRDLRWTDLLFDSGKHGFVVVQRGGSGLTTKNKKVRRIPMHPELRARLLALPRPFERVFTAPANAQYPDGGGLLNERTILQSLKDLCAKCEFANPRQYKLHTFRHAFASMCARTNVSYKYALTWMGHSSSEILDMYYMMYDDTAEAAMNTISYPIKPTAAPVAQKAG